MCGKNLYQVELARNTLDIMWGFSVEAELVENSEKQVGRPSLQIQTKVLNINIIAELLIFIL